MTIAPERPASTTGEQLAEPSPVAHRPRPHHLAASIAAGVLAADTLAWLLLRPLDQRATLLLIAVASMAAAVLVGAVGCLSARPIPPRGAR